MLQNAIYESSAHTITWGGNDLSSGWGTGVFLEVKPLRPSVRAVQGIRGESAPLMQKTVPAQVTLTLTQTAALNDVLASIHEYQLNNQEIVAAAMNVSDANDSTTKLQMNTVYLVESPFSSFGSESGEVSWTFYCEDARLLPRDTLGNRGDSEQVQRNRSNLLDQLGSVGYATSINELVESSVLDNIFNADRNTEIGFNRQLVEQDRPELDQEIGYISYEEDF